MMLFQKDHHNSNLHLEREFAVARWYVMLHASIHNLLEDQCSAHVDHAVGNAALQPTPVHVAYSVGALTVCLMAYCRRCHCL
jgi:hypothetical protein